MTFDEILSLIGQIATLATLVIVFLTLREMEKQRKSAQKPELIVPIVHFQGFCTKEENEILIVPTEWSDEEFKGMHKNVPVDIKTSQKFPELIIYNIGFGAAKNIKLEWQIDHVQDAVDAVKNYCYENSIPVVLSFEPNEIGVKMGRRDLQYYGSAKLDSAEHDYLLPASITSSGLRSSFPYPLTQILLPTLICLDLVRIGGKTTPEDMNFIEKISLQLKLSYEDVSNTKYVKQYKIELARPLGYIKPKEKKLVKKLICVSGFEFKETA